MHHMAWPRIGKCRGYAGLLERRITKEDMEIKETNDERVNDRWSTKQRPTASFLTTTRTSGARRYD